LECAIGKFPYQEGDVALKFWDYLNRIKDGPPPNIPDSFSDEFKDFISLCLIKEPEDRIGAKDLLKHPFILKHKKIKKELFCDYLKKQHIVVKHIKDEIEAKKNNR
jgi:serine/threonine protein kinase